MTNREQFLAILGVLLGPMAMGFSFSLINLNLKSIETQLGATVTQLQWIINIYGIFNAAFLVTMGRLGDIFGRKKIYLCGFLFFIIAMIGSGLSINPLMVLCFQIFYGLSAAVLLPISQAMLVHLFPDEKKSMSLGVWSAASGMSLCLGFLLGGFLMTHLSWRSIFFLNIPIALSGLLLTSLFAKESRTEGEPTSIDWLGTILLVLGIGSLIVAIVQGAIWHRYLIMGIYTLSACCFLLLTQAIKKAKSPVIRHDLFKNRTFFLAAMANFCLIAFFWAGIFLVPLFLQKEKGLSPFDAGLLMLGFSAPIALLSPLSGYLYNKIPPKKLIFLGFLFLITSAGMKFFYTVESSTVFIACGIVFLGIGISLVQSPITTIGLKTISRNFAGIASGTFVTIQELGGNIGLAVTLAVVSRYQVFGEGFRSGIWVVLGMTILGLMCVLLLPNKEKEVSYDSQTP